MLVSSLVSKVVTKKETQGMQFYGIANSSKETKSAGRLWIVR